VPLRGHNNQGCGMEKRNRYFVNVTYLAAIGQVSEILDRESRRRVLVAGANHRERAEARAAALNAAPEAVERRSPSPCCPERKQPRRRPGS